MVHVFSRWRSPITRFALALALVGSADEAAADGVYSEISVSKAGNFSAQIPLDKPFILTGDVGETVTTVRAVFIRYKFTAWNYPRRKGHPLRTCDDVFTAVEHGGLTPQPATGLSRFDQVFAEFKFPEPNPAEKLATDQRKTKAEAAYEALDKAGVHNVLSLGTDRFAPLDKDKNKKFAIQVSDRGFFRHGASYCLLIYQERPSGESIGPKLSEFAKKTLAEFERCREDPKRKESCTQLTGLTTGVEKILKDNGLPVDLATTIAPKIANIDARLPNAKKQLDDHNISLELPALAFKPGERLALDGVPVDLGPGEETAPGTEKAPPPPPPPQDELSRARRDFATFVLKALASNLAIHRQYAPVGGNAVESAFIVNNFVVRSVAFEKDGSVLVLGGVELKQRHQVSGLDKYKLPGFPELYLVDLIELARGRVIVGQTPVPLRELRTENKPDQVEPLFDPKSEDADKARSELAARLGALVGLLEHVSGNKSLVAWSDTDEVYAALRPWLAAIAAPPVKESKNDDDRQETEPALGREKGPGARKPTKAEAAAAKAAAEAAKKKKADEQNARITALKTELNDLRQLIVDYNDAARELRELPTALDIASKKKIVEAYAQTTVADAFTFGEREWFSSYVTPTLGLAFITQAHEPFALPYVGAQLYAWPNRFDEPMWTNGRSDFRRFFGFELGLGLSGFPKYERSFGTDDQYRPLSERYSTPPLLVGLVLQPLPYISTTLGCAFMTRAPTGLSRETAEPFRSFFVSITVQLNFFNAVRTLVLDQSGAELKPALFPSSK